MSIEMHCHTLFSVDAYGLPEDLVDQAAERGVVALAVTEHNHLGSLGRVEARAKERGIRFIPGIELDGEWKGGGYHFLGLGFDPEDRAVRELAERNTRLYEQRFELFFSHLAESGYRIPRADLKAGLARRYPTHPSPVLNQWYGREFLVEAGIFSDNEEFGRVLLETRDRIVREAGEDALGHFAAFHEVRDAVQNAGGLLLLAHVGRYFPGEAGAQIDLIHGLMADGMDGFELYHPANVIEPEFHLLRQEAEILGCPISGGSDSHGRPGNQRDPVGSSEAPESLLERFDAALAKRQGLVR
jgi:3',5'-nucleoside bisphosphate phosphatase